MLFLPKEPPVIGIDPARRVLRLATLRKKRTGWEIVHLEEKGNIDEREKGVLVSAIPSRDVLVRSLDLPVKKQSEIDAALAFQIEPLLPYAVDRAIIEKTILEKHALGTSLTVCAVRSDHLEHHLKSLSFEPERVTSTPCALAALTPLITSSDEILVVLHVGEREATCALVQRGKLLAAHTADVDQNSMQKALLSLCQSPKAKGAQSLLLLGDYDPFEKGIQEANPSLKRINCDENFRIFGLAIGTALASEIDFRKREFAYPKQWKRLKGPLLTGIAALTILTASLFGIAHVALSKQKEALFEKHRILLTLEKKQGELSTSLSALNASLSSLEEEIASRPDSFPLHPGIPKVSDLLAWLSLHQQAVDSETLIEFESLHYAMVSRPDLTHKKEKYLVRVDLEFSALTPSAARAFHDALLAPNLFVDPNQEVGWHAGKGKYRASFYLKDQTRYH